VKRLDENARIGVPRLADRGRFLTSAAVVVRDAVVLEVAGSWSAPLGMDLGRATFVLSPSSQQAVAA
jgi:hypothetical protein